MEIVLDKSPLKLLQGYYSKIPTDSLAPVGSKVELTESGVSLNGPTRENIWDTEERNGSEVAYAAILDNGNFLVILPIHVEADNGTILFPLLRSSVIPKQDFYWRAVLEHDGVFRQYVYPKRNLSSPGQEWNIASSTSMPSNICSNLIEGTGSGVCGYNSYCTMEDHQRQNCHCPKGYTTIDPNDTIKGCKLTFEPHSCDEYSQEADHFDFHKMKNADWTETHYEHFTPVTEDWCLKSCMRDCFCSVVYFGSGDCWKKQLPLRNGRISPSIRGSVMIKIREQDFTSKGRGPRSSEPTKKDQPTMLLIGFLSSSVFLNIMLIPWSLVLYRLSRNSKVIQPLHVMPGMNMKTFSYVWLDKVTNGIKVNKNSRQKPTKTRTTTGIRGTKGYVAPEWFKSMPVTAKVDVYSYGILLLELVCCRKNFEEEAEEEIQMVLADWAYNFFIYIWLC
ncbi:G-type lectin S-receptor-like serine/threonine-protein kinase LECRK1 [Humulus lupulus]|uniref:G-type lectin S-receptor-like serine/threonine-protein kinase LECRK1 n=1 Tax=Humulus lupulus TaxID=3486 RepID=UPI002B40F53F|nr:G-type lectin S-receptor-like serine/threonine-protein kinase LECRK1 [Humulus lupulus]